VPIYNHSQYLAECLESLTAQTAGDWEAVVVDDCSTTGDVSAIVETLGDRRVRLIRHEHNRGLAASRNTGMRAGGTEFVLPLDADDKLAPRFLEEAFAAVQTPGSCDAVFTDFMAFGVRGGRIRFQVRDVKALLTGQWIPGPGTLFRRTLWERAGGYCEADELRAGNEDWDFWLSVAEHGLRAVHVPEPLYLYRQHAESMVTRLQYYDHLTRLFIYDRHRALFDQYGMKNAFLSGGCFCSAKARWQKHERRQAVSLGIRSLLLSPSGCTHSVVDQVVRLLRTRAFADQAPHIP
jgi:glycosyltransferase involved in cell wall biosynthesis